MFLLSSRSCRRVSFGTREATNPSFWSHVVSPFPKTRCFFTQSTYPEPHVVVFHIFHHFSQILSDFLILSLISILLKQDSIWFSCDEFVDGKPPRGGVEAEAKTEEPSEVPRAGGREDMGGRQVGNTWCLPVNPW